MPERNKEQATFQYKEKPIQGFPKVAVFISGNGTNLERILEEVEQGNVPAQIVGVVSNKEDAYGVTRAKNHHVPVFIVPSKGLLKDLRKREVYMNTLIDITKQLDPDVIVFAGWKIVMDAAYLQWMKDEKIIGINLHPAILAEGNVQTVMTKSGEIPVIRGAHAIEDAYRQNLPVSGVTVHQLLPGMVFDTGPIILQEEVCLLEGESFDEWENRMHQAEHRMLPVALNRVLEQLRENIDVSKGDFLW